jgi:transcriptional regulator of heat shock response
MVAILANTTNNISFATLPEQERVFYIGLGNILKKPEFFEHPERATQVVEVLENELYDALSDLEISTEGGIYIGEENILPGFRSCSLLACPYEYNGFKEVIGILGPMRMNYAYNMAALRSAAQLL